MKTTKEKIAVMEAFERGEEIVCYGKRGENGTSFGKHLSVNDPQWNWETYDYRIKPKPTLRPWHGPSEVPFNFLYRHPNQNVGYFIPLHVGFVGVTVVHMDKKIETIPYRVLVKGTHSTDNGNSWLPCGVME